MSKLILVAALITLVPGLAFGQAGDIGIYVDWPSYTYCNVTDAAPGLFYAYVVHKLCPGATTSRFMVAPSGGFNMTYLSETHHVPVTFGDAQTGICMVYGACRASDILLITITYFGQGLSEACSRLEVVADPTSPSGTIEVMNCSGLVLAASSSPLYVNIDGSCDCRFDSSTDRVPKSTILRRAATDVPGDFCYPLPTQNGSWGQVKVLYD